MAAKNDITGDSTLTKVSSDAYRNNFDNIFGKKSEDKPIVQDMDISDSDSTKTKNNDWL